MSKRQIDLSFLDEPAAKPIDLSFLDNEQAVTPELPQRRPDKNAQAWRDLQAERFPTKDEGGDPDEVASKPFSSLLSPRGLWTQGKTALFDIFGGIVSPFRNAKSFSPGLELVRAAHTLSGDLGTAREHAETSAGKAQDLASREGGLMNWSVAGSKTLLNMLPVVGPMVNNMAEEGADPSKIAGHIEGMLLAKKVLETTASPIKATKGAYGAVKNAAIDVSSITNKPWEQVFKSIRPKNQPKIKMTPTEDNMFQSAMGEAAHGSKVIDEPIKNLDTFSRSLEAARKARIAEAKTLRANDPGYHDYDMTPVAKAIKDAIPTKIKVEDPAMAKAIVDWADETYHGKKMDLETVDGIRQGGNAEDAPYYNKLSMARMVSDRKLTSAISKARTDAVRKVEYEGLEQNTGGGKALQEINRQIRDIIQVEDYTNRRYNVELRQAMQNLPQQVSKLMAFGRFAKAVKMLAAHSPTGAAGQLLMGLGEVGLADFMKELNSSNGQIASAFRRFEGTRKQISLNPISRAAANRSLTAGTTARTPVATVQPSTLTGSATPGNAYEGWNQQGAVMLPAHAPLRNRLGQITSATHYTGDLPPSIRPVGRGVSGQIQSLWKTALEQHTKTMRDVLHAGEVPLKRDPKTGRFLPREKVTGPNGEPQTARYASVGKGPVLEASLSRSRPPELPPPAKKVPDEPPAIPKKKGAYEVRGGETYAARLKKMKGKKK